MDLVSPHPTRGVLCWVLCSVMVQVAVFRRCLHASSHVIRHLVCKSSPPLLLLRHSSLISKAPRRRSSSLSLVRTFFIV